MTNITQQQTSITSHQPVRRLARPDRLSLAERLTKAIGTEDAAGRPGGSSLLREALADLVRKDKEVLGLKAVIDQLKREATVSLAPAVTPTCVMLPGDSSTSSALQHWEENPPPDSRCESDLVVAQGRAIKILCQHYGWVRIGHGTLVKHRTGERHLQLVPEPDVSLLEAQELVESPGTIAEQAAIAAAAIE